MNLLKTRVYFFITQILLFGLCSCQDIPANSPFDPESAVSLQAPAQLSLTVIFPNQISRESLQGTDSIDLIRDEDFRKQSEELIAFRSRLIIEGTQANSNEAQTLTLRLEFNELPPGIYWLKSRI